MWDLQTLECAHALRQPLGAAVDALAAVGAEVWGAVGREVAVWGRA